MVDSIQVKAVGISMPILPYIPPNSAQIMDLISNAFGVTAPAIEDAEEKMDAYMKIYQGILGQTYTTFKEKLDNIIDNAKTSGKIVIDSSASAIIQQALKQAVSRGYETDTTQAITNFAEIKTKILQDFSSTFITQLSDSKWSRMQYQCEQKFGNNPYTCMAFNAYGYGDTYLFISFYPATENLNIRQNYTYNNITYPYAWTGNNTTYSSVIWNGRVLNNFSEYGLNEPFINVNSFYQSIGNVKNYGVVANYETVSTQSQSITDALTTQEVIPVTANTDTADMTGDIVINIPAVTVYPAETVNDLPTVQEKLGVVPTTPDTTAEQLEAIMEQLQEAQTETYGDVAQYSINLTEYFPFCIPFDIGNILTMFVAEPQAPCVTFELPIGYDTEDGIIMEEFTLDLSQFDTVALWCRRGMLLVFIVGLAMVTRQVFLRG